MENHKLVMTEDLNHFGFLFGGNLLKWVDEYAWIAATLDYPGCNLVTVAMDKIEFKRSVRSGSILRFVVEKLHVGNTSVKYTVKVFSGRTRLPDDAPIFTTNVTFVSIDENGNKRSLQ